MEYRFTDKSLTKVIPEILRQISYQLFGAINEIDRKEKWPPLCRAKNGMILKDIGVVAITASTIF